MKRITTAATLAAALALMVALAAASTAAAGPGKTLFRYVGQVSATSGSSVTMSVQTGTRPALRSLIGQSQVQTFTTGSSTVFLRWTAGIPKQVSIGDIEAGDIVAVNIRAPRGSSLATVVATPAALVGDHGPTLVHPDQPLYLFRGKLVAAAGGLVTVDVKGGNKRALRLMIGQDARQAFATASSTVFLQWSHRVPTVVDPSQLHAGDPVIVRVRAPGASTLQVVETTGARRVATHEPKRAEQQQSAQA
jgi:hypothetical protein